MPFSAQLTLAFDGIILRVEAPGRNGMREKVEGLLFSDLPLEIQHNLLAQLAAQRDRAEAELRSTQNRNIAYVASAKGMGTRFARQIWGQNGEHVKSRTIRARLAKTGQFDPTTGRIASDTKKPTNPRKQKIDDSILNGIDLEL